MRKARYILKGALSVFLLWYVFSSVGWSDILSELRGVDPLLLVLFLTLGGAQVLISAWKWQILGAARGLGFSLWTAFLLYLKGIFFSQVLPTSVGGDVVRGFELGRSSRRMPDAIASVFIERFTGLVALLVYAIVAIPLNPVLIDHPGVKMLLFLTLLAFVVGSWLVVDERGRRWLERRVHGRLARRLLFKARQLQEAITAYRHHSGAIAASMALSFLFYALGVVNIWVACHAFGLQFPFAPLLTAVPLMLLIFLVPISIGGLGLNEWAFTAVLALVGVPSTVGLAVAILHRGRSLLFALAGGSLYPLESVRSVMTEARSAVGSPPPVTAERIVE